MVLIFSDDHRSIGDVLDKCISRSSQQYNVILFLTLTLHPICIFSPLPFFPFYPSFSPPYSSFSPLPLSPLPLSPLYLTPLFLPLIPPSLPLPPSSFLPRCLAPSSSLSLFPFFCFLFFLRSFISSSPALSLCLLFYFFCNCIKLMLTFERYEFHIRNRLQKIMAVKF